MFKLFLIIEILIMTMDGCLDHLQAIEIIVVVGIVKFKVIKTFFVVAHLADVLVMHMNARQIFLNVSERQNSLELA